MTAYDDIISLPHHEPKTRPRMPMADRAAQFSAFAALSGHDAAISETARTTEQFISLDEEALSEINRQMNYIKAHLASRPLVSLTYFVEDGQKEGGSYHVIQDAVKRIDEECGIIEFCCGVSVAVACVVEVRRGENNG